MRIYSDDGVSHAMPEGIIFVVCGGMVILVVLWRSYPMEPGVPLVGIVAEGNNLRILTVDVNGAICVSGREFAMVGDAVGIVVTSALVGVFIVSSKMIAMLS